MQQHQQGMSRRNFAHLCEQRLLLPATQGFEDVLNGFNQHRTIADQLMAAPGAGMMDGAGNGKHFASLFRRQPRGDQ
ncbi:hypothetical protein D3C76_1665170 [compost metagenome]